MGLKDWVLGWTKDLGVEQTGLAEETQQHPFEPVEVVGDFQFLAKGTSFRQDAIKSLGIGKHKFVLAPESGNKHDDLAVMVFGVKENETVHVGYLPMGSDIQAIAHELGLVMLSKGLVLSIDGEVLQGDSGFIVQLEMPDSDKLVELLGEYS